MQKKQILIVILFNIILAFGFYINDSEAEATDISSDLANIMPICIKLDNPNLFKNDLYLNDINNVKYYTPFYIQSLRFLAQFTDHNYIKALNLFSLITHFFYGILWFYFFFLLRKDFWLAFGFSIFMRGIIWPPGMELLGISDMWTIMPRTIFVALIPLPFIIYKKLKNKNVFLPAIILGLLVNFHPISGVGAIILYVILLFSNYYFENQILKNEILKKTGFIFLGLIIGMLPYLITYFLNVKSNTVVNQELFNVAIRSRIDAIFFDPILFLKSWNRPVFYFFVVCFFIFYFFDSSINKRNFKTLLISILGLIIFSNSIVYIENFVNTNFNFNFRLSFQLIRSQKLIILVMQIALFLMLDEAIKKYMISNNIKFTLIATYLLILSFSSAPIINKLPFVGEDISTFILPNSFKVYSVKKKDNSNLLSVFEFINSNTNINDIYYCENIFFRTATKRSEILDFHAAGMLIEGNQNAYIEAYQDYTDFQAKNETERIKFLKAKNVDYIIDKSKWGNLKIVFSNKEYFVYKL